MDKEIKPCKSVGGVYTPPPDKSITHRCIMLASVAEGKSIIENPLMADDCIRTLNAFKSMGVKILTSEGKLEIEGVGLDGLKKPDTKIDAGNSGTTVRLLAGILAGQDFEVEIIGDDSLSKRPMKRIVDPLRLMGVGIKCRDDNFLPMTIKGTKKLKPIEYENRILSAQVKSCILFAGMQAIGTTTIIENIKSRDHSERLLKYLGAEINTDNSHIYIKGRSKLKSRDLKVVGDFSSAAYFIALGILNKGAELKITNVGLNPTRIGFLEKIIKMGADIKIENLKYLNNEPFGDIIVKHSVLKNTTVYPEEIPQMIDEIPLLALVATQSYGRMIIEGAGELRVKESDRLKTISSELKKLGANINETDTGLIIEGPTKLNGCVVESYFDHRIAMTLSIAGTFAENSTIIKNAECVNISYPNFFNDLSNLII